MDKINPEHYKKYPVEVIDMMVKICGKKKTAQYCLMNAFKYRMRAGHKDAIDQDLAKENWYLRKHDELNGRPR